MSQNSFLHSYRPEKIAVFRALMLGDMLCFGPALDSLRTTLPTANISLVGLPWCRQIHKQLPGHIDRFIEFPGYPGLPEREVDMARIGSFIDEMQKENFDLVIQAHGCGSIVNPLVSTFGSKHTGGYYRAGDYCPNNYGFIEYPEHIPEIWRHLRLMQHLGVEVKDDLLRYCVSEEAQSTCKRLLLEYGVDAPYVCIHPGTRAAWRCWPPEKFSQLADQLVEAGYAVIITGSDSERQLAQTIADEMTHPVTIMAGKTGSIDVLAALLKGASLTVCGDTGISHLACSVKCPSVVIFMRSELEGWPPLNRLLHRVVCHVKDVTVDLVLDQALDLIKKSALSELTTQRL